MEQESPVMQVEASEMFEPREGWLRVEVVDMKGTSTKLHVQPQATMLQIKQMLEKVEGFPVWQQSFGVEWSEIPLQGASTAQQVLKDGCKIYVVKSGTVTVMHPSAYCMVITLLQESRRWRYAMGFSSGSIALLKAP
jgi:hypothetical protein